MGYRILIVDDSTTMQKILTDFVSSEKDFNVAGTAVNAQGAIAKYQELNPDLVLLDISLPKESGLEALKQIKNINPYAKIIIVTALDQHKEEALKIGAADFIIKPFDKTGLVKVIKRTLGKPKSI